MAGPLKNIRVVDLSRVLAGPVCTQILGDLGADIIKIERPNSGDDTRKWGPPFLKDKDGNDTRESAYYLSANRNKKSVAVDITTTEGQNIIHRLLEKSDVLIENFKVGNLEKFGLSYDQIKERHKHLIYASITGFGQTGPLATEPGYDFLAQGMSGLMAATGNPGEEPMKAGVALSDVMSGLYACIGILASLHERKTSTQGQHIDISLLDCTLASMTNLAQYFLTSGKIAPRLGNAHSTIVPYQAFRAADGYIILAIGNDTQFKRFAEHAGKDWSDDERFATNSARVKNREILIPDIAELIAQQTTAYWLKALRTIDVPAGPVNTMDQVFADEQIASRAMKINMTHATTGQSIDLVGSPIKLSRSTIEYNRAPPVEGQDTDDVLSDILGLDDDEIAKFKFAGIVK